MISIIKYKNLSELILNKRGKIFIVFSSKLKKKTQSLILLIFHKIVKFVISIGKYLKNKSYKNNYDYKLKKNYAIEINANFILEPICILFINDIRKFK